jgi:type 1 glutamine amidotransferase
MINGMRIEALVWIGKGFGIFWLMFSLQTHSVAQTQQIRALIVDGFSNHDWGQTSRAIKWILESSGRFQVEISTLPLDSMGWQAWNPVFKSYDVVIQNTNNIHNPRLEWPEPAKRDLERYVKEGGGLYILHSANNAFPDWKEYDRMIGMGWRSVNHGTALEIIPGQKDPRRYPPGEGKGTSHGDRFDALIQRATSHPINEGFPEAWKTKNTEVYSFPRGPAENLTVLSYAYDSTETQKIWPVEWVVEYGAGRVYNSSMGHLWTGETFPPAYRCAGFQTIVVRAAEWVATGNVTFPVPDDFPDKDQTSLRPEIQFTDPKKP